MSKPGLPFIPPIIHRTPQCPLCDGDTDWEDGWVCQPCEVFWPEAYEMPGQPLDDARDYEVCGAEIVPWADKADEYPRLAGHRYRCVRKHGHQPPKPISPLLPARLDYHVGVRTDVDPTIHHTHEWLVKE